MPLYRAQLTLTTLEWGHRRPARLPARPPWPRARRQYRQMMRLVQRLVHRLRQRLSCRRCRCPASLSPRTSTRVARARQACVTARGLTAVRTATQERSQLRSWRCVAGRRRQRMALHRSTRRHRLLRPRLEWKCPPRHTRRPPRRRQRRSLIPAEVLTPSHAQVVRRSQAPRVNSSHVRQCVVLLLLLRCMPPRATRGPPCRRFRLLFQACQTAAASHMIRQAPRSPERVWRVLRMPRQRRASPCQRRAQPGGPRLLAARQPVEL
jgi:hypothetical protein